MKKKFFVVLLLAVLVIGITGCGKKETSDKSKKEDKSVYAGTYVGKYTKFVGDSDSSKNEEEEFSLELKKDGTGIHNRNDNSYDVKWSIKGSKFKMTETFLGISIDYTGILKDGKLNIFNGDPDDDLTLEYVYEKE